MTWYAIGLFVVVFGFFSVLLPLVIWLVFRMRKEWVKEEVENPYTKDSALWNVFEDARRKILNRENKGE